MSAHWLPSHAANPFRERPAAWRPAFPQRYLVFATLGLCDFVQTCLILSIGGDEANAIALWIMKNLGLAATAAYKFALIGLVICLIEWILPRDPGAARRLANYALAIGAFPVLFGMSLLTIHYGSVLLASLG